MFYQPEPVLSGFETVGGTTYRLQSSIGLANTTITLSSFKSRSGIPWTMSLLNTDIVFATIDPSTNSSEFVSFTGIVQNVNGTATLTGVTRGLMDFYPYTASSTMQRAHAGQATFIISDAPQVFNEYAAKRNNEYISGIWGFGALPIASTTCTVGTQFCNKDYIDSVVVGGAPPAGYVIPGIGIVATGLQMASSTASTTYTAIPYPNLLTAENSTSTSNGTVSALHAIISDNAGKLATSWISNSYHYIFGSLFATNASTTNATTTNLGITGDRLSVNGVEYRYPAVQGVASTTLVNNGSGTLSWNTPEWTLVASTTLTGSTATTTLTVPTRNYYMVKVRIVTSGNHGAALIFNGDTGANYATKPFIDNASNACALTNILCVSPINSGSDFNFTFQISGRPTTLVKPITWTGWEISGNQYMDGGGDWNNTSSGITSIGFGAIDANMQAGSQMQVWASTN